MFLFNVNIDVVVKNHVVDTTLNKMVQIRNRNTCWIEKKKRCDNVSKRLHVNGDYT